LLRALEATPWDGGYHVAQFVLFGLLLGLWH
jgi:hypothetical protein